MPYSYMDPLGQRRSRTILCSGGQVTKGSTFPCGHMVNNWAVLESLHLGSYCMCVCIYIYVYIYVYI